MDSLRIVGIGGGTGLPVVLRGLAAEPNVDVSAIVTVTDNGGSSGRLRESFGVPAVGDLRNCLVALSGRESMFADLFQHRFSTGDVNGHTLGNLIVAALYQKTGSLQLALEAAGDLLHLNGRVLAATEIPATLCARFQDGSEARGEVQISAVGKRIDQVWLEPQHPGPTAGVLEIIESANVIVLAPGSLFTSLMPNLLVADVAERIRRSSAITILVCNLMTEPAETDGFSASAHVRVLQTCLGDGIDFCIVNSATDRADSARYRDGGSQPVQADLDAIAELGVIPVEADLFNRADEKVRHNPTKLARLIVSIAQSEGDRWQAAQADWKRFLVMKENGKCYTQGFLPSRYRPSA
jgi:uncharacterized cofD-like protein